MHLPHDLDRATLIRVVHGDHQALAKLYDQYANALAGYLAHLIGDAAVAEELAQDLFVIVWRDASRFRGDSTVRSWLFGIAHKLGLMELRRKRPEPLDETTADWLVASDPDPSDLADLALDRERLQMAMETLPASHRAVIELTFYHGLGRAEVAQALGCPVGTVKSRLHYALQALARALA
jgi:RNA polymerase sigma-70 factor, ECF subfamily